MIKATIIGDSALITRMNGLNSSVRASLRAAVLELSIKLQRRVKADKLSGQVLKVRTGRLRRSINYRVQEQSNGVFGFVGTNVKYGAAHEYGYAGVVNVKAHLRKSKDKASPVRAHTRTVNMPERSFLRSALNDMKLEITQGIKQAAVTAVKGKL